VKKEVEVVDMPSLIIVTGIPGSGKTTFIKSHKASLKKYVHISRDEIRFQFLHGEDNYFKYEPQVLKEFYLQINKFLYLGFNVFADATHLTKKGRKELLDNVKGYTKLESLFFNTPLSIALERNSKREGLERVPDNVIRGMYRRLEEPDFDEGFETIYEIPYPKEKILIRKKEDA
jgi:predicted kinase